MKLKIHNAQDLLAQFFIYFSDSAEAKAMPKPTVLPFLAIYRQIREFGPRLGDEIFGLAIHRQSLNIRDFEPLELAKSANFKENRRYWRILECWNLKTEKFLPKIARQNGITFFQKGSIYFSPQ